jgi:hypothetical protein
VPAVTLAVPIPAEHLETWRRFIQELALSKRPEFERSRKTVGVSAETIWLVAGIAVWWLEAEDPEAAILRLAASDQPFDRWFNRQVYDLVGLELIELLVQSHSDLVLEWKG